MDCNNRTKYRFSSGSEANKSIPMNCCTNKRSGGIDKPVTDHEMPLQRNRKLYSNIKSRYMGQREPPVLRQSNNCRKHMENVKLAMELENESTVMSPAHQAYLEFVEADGRLDGAASALGLLLATERDRHDEKSQPLRTREFDAVKLVLAGDDGSSLALVRAALAFVRADGPADGGGGGDDVGSRWLWAAELCLLAAVSRAETSGGPDEVTCLFVAGWFYARGGRTPVSLRFLDSAWRAADDGHRWDWHLPEDVTDATGVVTDANGRQSAWWSACFTEIQVLMEAAGGLDADRTLRAVRAACWLADRCGMDDEHRAPILYELGVRYTAVGAPDHAIRCFKECTVTAVGHLSGLDLEARLQEMAMAGRRPGDDCVLQRIADEALDRKCGRALVKAIAARGLASARRDRPNEACRLFALAHRLGSNVVVDDVDLTLSTRLNAAVCQTSVYLQSNLQHLSHMGFNLQATEAPRRWTGSRSPLIQRDSKGRMYLDTEPYQDVVVKSQARKILDRLSATNDYAKVEETEEYFLNSDEEAEENYLSPENVLN